VSSQKKIIFWVVAAVALAVGTYFATHTDDSRTAVGSAVGNSNASRTSNRASSNLLPIDSIELSEKDVAGVKPEPVGEREFPIEKTAGGSIDFNQNMTLQVFTPYPGRIVRPL